MGIEPTNSAWEADVMPLNYACKFGGKYRIRTYITFRSEAFKASAIPLCELSILYGIGFITVLCGNYPNAYLVCAVEIDSPTL